MSFFSIVLALLLEQAKPLPVGRINARLASWSSYLERRFNAGERRHGMAAWFVGVALPAAVLAAIYFVVVANSWPLALAIGVASLYLTTGFRQFSHYFTNIHEALRNEDVGTARRVLAEWRGGDTERLSSGEVARLTIEQALLASHRHVFAPLFWFTLLGPAGVLLYRLSSHFSDAWQSDKSGNGELEVFGEFARRFFDVFDWLPVRLSAASFAVVGNFEDAIFCWRTQSDQWPDESGGILLSAGAGALGVRLGLPIDTGGQLGVRPELGVGDDADADFLRSTVGLVWRSLVMAMLLLTLLSVASWVGR